MRALSIIVISLLLACTNDTKPFQNRGMLTLTWKQDSCYLLMDANNKPISVSRELEIIENTLEDTALLGYAVLPPKYTGKFNYLRTGDGLIYPETPKNLWPKSDSICVNQYQKKALNGKVIIKYYY